MRRRTASQAAQRFHAQLEKAQAQMRQPLGRTAPVHAAARGDDEHCWQPHADHRDGEHDAGASGGASGGAEGLRAGEADAPRPEGLLRPVQADQDLTLDDITRSSPLSMEPSAGGTRPEPAATSLLPRL